jgi:hypothetical protein
MAASFTSFKVTGPQRRTNSLAFAKRDCHTCAETDATCDRRRPRCGPCLSGGRTCGGFAQDLKWRRPADTSTCREPVRRDRTGSVAHGTQTQYRFVAGRAKQRRQTKTHKAGEYSGFSHQWRAATLPSVSETVVETSSDPESALDILISDSPGNDESSPASSSTSANENIPFSLANTLVESLAREFAMSSSNQACTMVSSSQALFLESSAPGSYQETDDDSSHTLDVIRHVYSTSSGTLILDDDFYGYNQVPDSQSLTLTSVLYPHVVDKYRAVLELCKCYLIW